MVILSGPQGKTPRVGPIGPLRTLTCIKAALCTDANCGQPFALAEETTRWFWVSQIPLMRSSDFKGRWTSSWKTIGPNSGVGAFPPINVFRQGQDCGAIIEMPGISKDDLGLEVKGTELTEQLQ